MRLKAFAVTFIAIWFFFGISLESHSELLFAGNWNRPVEVRLVSSMPVDKQDDVFLNYLLEKCKQMILSSRIRRQYPNFNWERFKDCKIAFVDEDTFKDCDEGYCVHAEYNMEQNLIMMNKSVPNEFYDQYEITIIHELIHCLTVTEAKSMIYFKEGVAEYFTENISEKFGLYFRSSIYLTELDFTKILILTFGEKQTIDMMLNGEIEKMIDSYSDKGMGNKLENAITWLSINRNKYEEKDMEEYEELMKVSEDILCHVARNYGRTMQDKERYLLYREVKNHLGFRNKYFEQLMKVE